MEPRSRARQVRSNPTDAEVALWRALSARKVADARFNRQVVVGPFICDFVARSRKLIVEVDGGQHGIAADAGRTRYLEDNGFRVIRFWNHEVLANLEGVVAESQRVLAEHPSPNPSRKREGSAELRAGQ
ncbi:endonuclease domain-containing protein [Sphingomonas canadensis]|uniref:Endonuclease domain-containing protein n=1 Tax=Sphingomonas canadensis TaxID=1219257 RepID=A0ABW3H697_9SPHN|nr:DUF559 domain-containing protein [Sphingomonas canadensis]MCW3836844.1 DUF559 domain-containing protein [Sphingomonas canadensis]